VDDLDLFSKELQLSGYKVRRVIERSRLEYREWGYRRDLIIEVPGELDIVLGMIGRQYEVYRAPVSFSVGRRFDKLEDALEHISELLRND
jgi:hypothetical protein